MEYVLTICTRDRSKQIIFDKDGLDKLDEMLRRLYHIKHHRIDHAEVEIGALFPSGVSDLGVQLSTSVNLLDWTLLWYGELLDKPDELSPQMLYDAGHRDGLQDAANK